MIDSGEAPSGASSLFLTWQDVQHSVSHYLQSGFLKKRGKAYGNSAAISTTNVN